LRLRDESLRRNNDRFDIYLVVVPPVLERSRGHWSRGREMAGVVNKYVPIADLLGDLAHLLLVGDRSGVDGAFDLASNELLSLAKRRLGASY
jgi:hypothetical protein